MPRKKAVRGAVEELLIESQGWKFVDTKVRRFPLAMVQAAFAS